MGEATPAEPMPIGRAAAVSVEKSMKNSDPRLEQTLSLDLDVGTGLRVAPARFQSETKFSWSLFDGYDRIRILTYSAGACAIVHLSAESTSN